MFDVAAIRKQFPSLLQTQDGKLVVYFDNPGGTQVPQRVIDAMVQYLQRDNSNHGGAFPTSRRSDAMLEEAHQAMADMLGAASHNEVAFGPNMTTLTMGLSRALAHWVKPGDEVIVTRLDHDANISPWMLLARDAGATVRWVDFRPEDCSLNLDDMERQLSKKTRIVACGLASNAVGTINDVEMISRMAHAYGALVFVDAVQYAPHGPMDVQALDCDFLICSAYKFFGPHEGVLYGKYDLLDRLPAYKVRPADNRPPHKFETGTQNHEGIAGVLGAIEYFEWVGREFGGEHAEGLREYSGRTLELKKAMAAIHSYEFELNRALLSTLEQIPGITLFGLTDMRRLDERVATFSFRLQGQHPRDVAQKLADAGIYVWDGNYYALNVTERLDVEDKGGMVRVGAAHYNTLDEVARLGEVLQKIAK